MTRRTTVSVLILLFTTVFLFAAPQETPSWKRYLSSEYRFEISYPADWGFDSGYQNNYGKPPSAGQRPAYAGETRSLFGLEIDGPTQSQDGGVLSMTERSSRSRLPGQAEPSRTGTSSLVARGIYSSQRHPIG